MPARSGAIPFLFGLALVLRADAVGTLYGTEVLLFLALPFLLHRHGFTLVRGAGTFLVLCAVWLLSQLETDIIRETALLDASRGASRVLVMVSSFVALCLLCRSREQLTGFAWGLAIGLAAATWLYPHIGDDWKFGLATPTMLAVGLLLGRRSWEDHPYVPSAAFLAAAGLNLVLGFRSMMGICLAVSVLLALGVLGAHRNRGPRRVSGARIGMVMAAGFVALFAGSQAYAKLAAEGILGREAQRKQLIESRGGDFTLLQGRPEFFVSSLAIRDSPIIGHGSWASDRQYLFELKAREFRRPISLRYDQPIPAHSHLLGAWVEGGVLSIAVWLWVLYLALGAVIAAVGSRDRWAPLVMFVGILAMWDVLFSPFGAERRVLTAFYVLVLLLGTPLRDPMSRTHWLRPR